MGIKNKDKIIDILNEIMRYELSGVVRYTHYALMVTGRDRLSLTQFFKEQATESLLHAQQAGELVTGLDGHPSLEISIIEESNKHAKNLSFLVRFDFEHGVTELFTIRNVESGLEKGHLPPPSLRQFISQGCVDVFCFQGDKIKDIIDSEKEDAEVTINAFFGFDDINTFLNE